MQVMHLYIALYRSTVQIYLGCPSTPRAVDLLDHLNYIQNADPSIAGNVRDGHFARRRYFNGQERAQSAPRPEKR